MTLHTTTYPIIKATATAVGLEVAAALGEARSGAISRNEYLNLNLPKILADMIDSTLVSETDPRRLVRFLIRFKQVIKLDLVPLNNVILDVLPKNFLTGRVRKLCVSEMLYRLQKPKETLADFVSDLQSLADIVLTEFGEQDLVDTVLKGLNPDTRARLAGFPPPTIVDHLYAFSPRIDVIRSTEMQFHREYTISSGVSGGMPTRYSNRNIQDVHNQFRGYYNSCTAFGSIF
ncbi:hypothetical protein J6590_081428 [Homalodisca vitripennis]|nr:hypothetical protein J6590_081428 [Homalodisca vitripennis]